MVLICWRELNWHKFRLIGTVWIDDIDPGFQPDCKLEVHIINKRSPVARVANSQMLSKDFSPFLERISGVLSFLTHPMGNQKLDYSNVSSHCVCVCDVFQLTRSSSKYIVFTTNLLKCPRFHMFAIARIKYILWRSWMSSQCNYSARKQKSPERHLNSRKESSRCRILHFFFFLFTVHVRCVAEFRFCSI